MTAGTIPVTTVRDDEQEYKTIHRDLTSNMLIENARKSAGLPVGVQIISAPYKEEKVLGMMSFLEKKIRFYEHHPLPRC